MHRRRPAAALFLGQCRAVAALFPAHHFPELVEVVRGGGGGQLRLDLRRQFLIGAVHVGEFGAAERLAVPARNLDAEQHVHETHHIPVGHVRVPFLAGIGQADIGAALLDVGQDADLRRFLVVLRLGGLGDRALDVPEPFGEDTQLIHRQVLVGEAQHAIAAELHQQPGEDRFLDGSGRIQPLDRGADHGVVGRNGEHVASSCVSQVSVSLTAPPMFAKGEGPEGGYFAPRICRTRSSTRRALATIG